MPLLNRHIILIGFKHVGKSTIGKRLAESIQAPYVDLDKKIEKVYEDSFNKKYSCRQIVQTHGEIFFRDLEKTVLTEIIECKPFVISLGGGTSPTLINRLSCLFIHITAPREIVLERIHKNGIPAFFDPDKNAVEFFNQLWDERISAYNAIQDVSIENNDSIDAAISKIIHWLTTSVPKVIDLA